MPTVTLNAYSEARPDIVSNRLKASIYNEEQPLALVASIIEEAPHLRRIWSFSGVPRKNYNFRLDEIDDAGNVLNNLADFDVVPSELDGAVVRDDEQYQVGNTAGFAAGTNTFTFDGSGHSNRPDFRGWEIIPSELTGRGILVKGVDYSWNMDTGVFTLLAPGDVFPEDLWYNFKFNPILQPAGNGYPTLADFDSRIITEDDLMVTTDFGNKIIVEPVAPFIELTLPNIATVVENRPCMVEVGGSGSCASFIPYGSDVINFIGGQVFALPNESFTIYKFKRAVGVYEWRVYACAGNFRRVGEVVYQDQIQSDVEGLQLLDGTIGNVNKHARIFNQHVLNLPVYQTVNYDDWVEGTDTSRYFSLANSANPLNADKFRFPDRRGMYSRPTSDGQWSGIFQENRLKYHRHVIASQSGTPAIYGETPLATANVTVPDGQNTRKQAYTSDPINSSGDAEGASETRPDSILINQYVIL